MKKKYNLLFIGICFAMMTAPFVGMLIAPTKITTENKVLKEFPEIKKSGKINVKYLNELGQYFEEHFAFRQNLVTINALIYGKIFKESTTDQVLIGKNNWMYYTGTLDDYLAENLMSERAVNNAAHNLKLMQDYVEARGSQFILTIAPNKNSVYDENMPYYYRKGEGKNYAKLEVALKNNGIHYVDLFSAFEKQPEVLYFERDSHWNNKGAVLAYNTLMKQISTAYETYDNIPYITKKDHMGDLTKMLYPENSELDENQYYEKNQGFSYVNGVTNNMEEWIETVNASQNQTLLMYRDSFGESLLPLFADEFEKAYFSRLVPYNMTNVDTCLPDYTIIERVERKIGAFAEQAAIMQAPIAEINDAECTVWEDGIYLEESGGYYVITGTIDEEYIDAEGEIYVRITDASGNQKTYVPFWISKKNEGAVTDYGYKMYVEKDENINSANMKIQVFIH